VLLCGIGLQGYTPMRLGVKMGMPEFFVHSLRQRVQTEWVWGPVASYKLPLIGLDTEGIAGRQTVMELACDPAALTNTKAMLLDSFMNGFVFHLFTEKWSRWAKYLWLFQTSVDWMLVVSVTLIASPSIIGASREEIERNLKLQASICLLLVAFVTEEQVRELITFYHANKANLRQSKSARKAILDEYVYGRIDNLSLIASVIFVCGWLVVTDDPQAANANPLLRVMVSVAACIAWMQVFLNSFVPFERFGVFVLLVNKMVFGDMTTWTLIVMPWLLGLTTSANAVSVDATVAPFLGNGGHSMSYWWYAFESFFLMMSNGVTPQFKVFEYYVVSRPWPRHLEDDTHLEDDGGRTLRELNLRVGSGGVGSAKIDHNLVDSDYPSDLMLDDSYNQALGFFFYMFYVLFCYIVMIMLLNLLIAMMGNTYEGAKETATLDWRGEFARLVLRLELSAFNTPIPRRFVARRDRVRERLTVLGSTIPGGGDFRYYAFRCYVPLDGLHLHGTKGDIFANDGAGIKEDPEEEAPETGPDTINRMAEDLKSCKAQLAQLIDRTEAGRRSSGDASSRRSPKAEGRVERPYKTCSATGAPAQNGGGATQNGSYMHVERVRRRVRGSTPVEASR